MASHEAQRDTNEHDRLVKHAEREEGQAAAPREPIGEEGDDRDRRQAGEGAPGPGPREVDRRGAKRAIAGNPRAQRPEPKADRHGPGEVVYDAQGACGDERHRPDRDGEHLRARFAEPRVRRALGDLAHDDGGGDRQRLRGSHAHQEPRERAPRADRAADRA